jgi:hypothetical protein
MYLRLCTDFSAFCFWIGFMTKGNEHGIHVLNCMHPENSKLSIYVPFFADMVTRANANQHCLESEASADEKTLRAHLVHSCAISSGLSAFCPLDCLATP